MNDTGRDTDHENADPDTVVKLQQAGKVHPRVRFRMADDDGSHQGDA